MTQIYCFSGSGHSMAVAKHFATALDVPVTEIMANTQGRAELALVIFPVYCQNVPPIVKAFLRSLDARHAVLIATYGGFSFGNVLYEAAHATNATVIAAAAAPTGHSFLLEGTDFDRDALSPILDRIRDPRPVSIPRASKHPFASFFPAWRSRVGLKITKTDACTDCGLCTASCPMGAMQDGIPSNRCMRCLRCVSACPQSALQIHPRGALKSYLTQPRKPRTVLYLN